MAGSDPNVTITFSGNADGAIRVATGLGTALDQLSVQARNAQVGITQAGAALSSMADRSRRVSTMAVAYDQATRSVVTATMHARRGVADFEALGNSVANAAANMQNMATRSNAAAPAIGRASNEAKGLSSAFGTGAMVKGAAAMAGVTVGAAMAGNEIKKLVTSNMTLDEAMSAVAAVGGLDKLSPVYAELLDSVQRLGNNTKFGAVGAAEGLKELIAAGYNATDAAKLLGDTLDLAATDNISMASASEIVVAGLKSMNLGVEQSTRLVNVLARAANASPAGVADLGESLKYIAPVANALGIPLEDLGASLAVLANNGLRGGMAGRGLTSVMSRMIAPTKDAQEVIANAGLAMDEINPQIVGLHRAFSNLGRIDQAGLVKLFGAENLDISNTLAANAASFPLMIDAMADTTASAHKMAKAFGDNLGGELKKAGSALDAVRREVGAEAYDNIVQSVGTFTQYVIENKDQLVEWGRVGGQLAVDVAKLAVDFYAVKLALGGLKFAKTAAEAINLAKAFAVLRDQNGLRSVIENQMLKNIGLPAGAANILTENVGTAFSSAFGSGSLKARVAKGTAMVGAVAAAAVAGWEIGQAIEKQFNVSGRVVDWMYADSDKIAESTNRMLQSADADVRGAKSAEELALAKSKIADSIAEVTAAMATTTDKKDLQAYVTTERLLQLRLKGADRLNAAVQSEAAALREKRAAQEADNELSFRAKQRAEAAAVALTRQKKAAEELAKALPEINKAIISSLPKAEQMDLLAGAEKRTLATANALKQRLNAALAAGGMQMIDPRGEIKSIDAFIAYYRAVMARMQASGDASLLGGAAIAEATAAARSALELKGQMDSADRQSKQDQETKVERERERLSVMSEIAELEARAAGDSAKADAIARQTRLLKEQQAIAKALGVNDAEALALAQRKVAAEDAIAKSAKLTDSVVASSLQEIGGGGGSFSAGRNPAEEQLRVQRNIASDLSVVAARLGLTGGTASASGTRGEGAATSIRLAELMSNSVDLLKQVVTNTGRGGGGVIQASVS